MEMLVIEQDRVAGNRAAGVVLIKRIPDRGEVFTFKLAHVGEGTEASSGSASVARAPVVPGAP